MNFQPLNDQILVERIEKDTISKGGIIIPDTAKEKPMEGTVVVVGKGVRKDDGSLQKLEVKEGDRILFKKWGGTEVTIDGKEHLVIKETEVLGIFKK